MNFFPPFNLMISRKTWMFSEASEQLKKSKMQVKGGGGKGGYDGVSAGGKILPPFPRIVYLKIIKCLGAISPCAGDTARLYNMTSKIQVLPVAVNYRGWRKFWGFIQPFPSPVSYFGNDACLSASKLINLLTNRVTTRAPPLPRMLLLARANPSL